MKVNVLDKNLKKSEVTAELNESVWSEKYNGDLVAQAVYVYSSNARTGNASAKGKGDVSGGGRKPWKQKGTGRARHGSSRSPLWVGGGVTFSPAGKNWNRSLNRKMKLKALAVVLSDRLRKENLMIADLKGADRNAFDVNSSYLVVTDSDDVRLKLRNLGNLKVVRSVSLNAKNALSGKQLVFDLSSLESLEKRFIK